MASHRDYVSRVHGLWAPYLARDFYRSFLRECDDGRVRRHIPWNRGRKHGRGTGGGLSSWQVRGWVARLQPAALYIPVRNPRGNLQHGFERDVWRLESGPGGVCKME